MWHYATDGRGKRDMVILPYKDRLHLFAKYLQQLIMESIGKEKDLQGKTGKSGHHGSTATRGRQTSTPMSSSCARE